MKIWFCLIIVLSGCAPNPPVNIAPVSSGVNALGKYEAIFLNQFEVLAIKDGLIISEKSSRKQIVPVAQGLEFSAKEGRNSNTKYRIIAFDLNEGSVIIEYYRKIDLRSFGQGLSTKNGQFQVVVKQVQ